VLAACGGGGEEQSNSQESAGQIFDSAKHVSMTAEQIKRFRINEMIQESFGTNDREQALAAAAPLTYLQVRTIYSSAAGYDYLSETATATAKDHGGGTSLRGFVLEVGYGGTPIIKMSGAVVPSSKTTSRAMCWINATTLNYCTAGQTIAGWWWTIDLGQYQEGTLVFSDTSLNSPWNTMSDQIYVR
jgi:Domain of unknown function (DUF4879)